MAEIDGRRAFDIPIELARFIADIAMLHKPKSVIDINCSTGQLLNCFPNELMKKGYDVDQNVIQLGKLLYSDLELTNMNPIHHNFTGQFDCVVSCFPRGGQIYYEGMEQNKSLVYFKKAVSLLKKDGILIALISNAFLTAPSSGQQLRDYLLNNYNVEMVINLDTGNFRPHLRGMSLVVIKHTVQVENVLMPSFNNSYVELKKIYLEKLGFSVKVDRLKGSRWDPNFYDPRFKRIDEKLENKDVKRLEEMATIITGSTIRSEERQDNGKYLIIKPSHMRNNNFNIFGDNDYLDAYSEREISSILQPGDIITPLINNNGEFYIYKETDPPAIASHNVGIIRSNNSEYIKTYLQTSEGQKLYSMQINRKSRGIQNLRVLTIRDLQNIRIPILPLENLNEVSDKQIENASKNELLRLKEKLATIREKYTNEKSRNKELQKMADNRYNKILEVLMVQDKTLIQINERVDEVNERVSYLINLVTSMDKDIKQIKFEGQNEREVLQSMIGKIDNTVKKITLETYDSYVEKTKEWIVPHWDKLHDLSKRLLPSADMLFENIERLENSDPSPYILQYCRSLENELQIKIFIAYLRDLKKRNLDLRSHFGWDFETNERGNPLSKNQSSYDFAVTIERLLEKDENSWHFELGRMSIFLTRLTGRTVNRSPILGDFKQFILRYFEENFVDIELFEKINIVTKEYRNKAAHPNVISMEEAKEGKEIIKQLILRVLKDYKENID